jgi:hypothetical protein
LRVSDGGTFVSSGTSAGGFFTLPLPPSDVNQQHCSVWTAVSCSRPAAPSRRST